MGPVGLDSRPDRSAGARTEQRLQAINLAVHLGAARIILLGYDLSPARMGGHWFGDHPEPIPSPYEGLRQCYATCLRTVGGRWG
jgi:hypothetical protein